MHSDNAYSRYRDKREKQRIRQRRRRRFFKVFGMTVLLGMVLVAAVALILAYDKVTRHDRTATAIAATATPAPTPAPQNGEENGFANETPRDEIPPPVGARDGLEGEREEAWMPPDYNPHHHDIVEMAKRSLGTFEITAYCPCKLCTGIWSRHHPDNAGNPDFVQRTASGTIPVAGRTAAVNLSLFYFGQEIYITGLGWRVAEDTGSAVFENVVDVFMDCHQEALRFGRQQREVFIVR